MKAITTKYLGPTNHCGARIKASDGDGNSATLRFRSEWTDGQNHKQAAIALCNELGWTGTLHAGHINNGMVFVFEGTMAFNV